MMFIFLCVLFCTFLNFNNEIHILKRGGEATAYPGSDEIFLGKG